ncbi:PIN domain-containing protein [Candidatus Micrarchaeota archaeon]|nr:PIN domain-containing protein [Candidatus Micrarchaeota archaeon]
MACLETTFLIDLMRGKQAVVSLMKELERVEGHLSIAVPSIMELWRGACLKVSAKEKEQVNQLLESMEVIHSLDPQSAKEAGEIEAELRRKGITIETEDIMIAGIARSNREKLVTRDQHFAQVDGLNLLKY